MQEEYELGYALLHADGTEFSYYIPPRMKNKLNWSSAKVSIDEERDEILIQPPNVVSQNATIAGNMRGMAREAGKKQVFYSSSNIKIVFECLEANEQTTIIVIGLTEKKDSES